MRVVVTGATGFIGGHVVRELLSRGHQVRALARASSNVAGLPPEVEIVRAELERAEPAMAQADGLIHLAGVGGGLLKRSDRDGRELRRVNVDGTRRIFEAARGAGIRRAVLVTSMWTVLRPDLAARSPYLRSRVDSERAALDAAGGAIETVIACPTFVVGAGDRGPNLPGSLIVAALRGRFPVVLPGGMTWIAVQDAARNLAEALDRGTPGERYLLGAEHLSWADWHAMVARAAGSAPPRCRLDRRSGNVLAWLADTALAVAGRRAAIPLRDGFGLLCLENAPDCRRTWEALGEPSRPVEDAVAEAVRWFRAHGYSAGRGGGRAA